MRKVTIVFAATALAAGLVAAPGVAGKGTKQVPATVSLLVAPTTIDATTTTLAASGNVASSSNCRKGRTVRFEYVNSTTGVVTPLAQTATTKGNGDFTATLPRPTDVAPATVVLRATVDQVTRKVGSKKKGKKAKKGRQFSCLEASGQSVPLAVSG